MHVREGSAFAPLAFPIFRSVWIASAFSNFGTLIQNVGAAWLMTSIASTPDFVAYVQAATSLPIMLFAMVAGAIADVFDRRRVILLAQAMLLASALGLAAVTWGGGMTPWLLLAFTFLIGIGTALNNPAWQASVGEMVPRVHLPAAVALNAVNFNLTRSVGPAIGGLIVAFAGPAAAFLINAMSYVGVIGAIHAWKPVLRQTTLPRESIMPAVLTGIRYVAISPRLCAIMFRGFVFGGAASVLIALLPLVARDRFGGDATLFGVLLAAYGVGAVGGALLGGRLRKRLSNELIARMAFLGYALCDAMIAFGSSLWVVVPGIVIGGMCWILAMSLFNVSVQLSSPRWVVARVLGIYQTTTFGGMAIGSWIWGQVADRADLATAYALAGAGLVIGALLGILVPMPDPQRENLDPRTRESLPTTAIDLRPQSGPVHVAVTYRVDPANAEDFQRAMSARRQMRRRNGAQHWELMRDLNAPDRWVETYRFSTWTDYIRHIQRTTHADATVTEAIRRFHVDSQPPSVQLSLLRDPRP